MTPQTEQFLTQFADYFDLHVECKRPPERHYESES